LIDPSALPDWVTSQNPAPAPSFSSATGWTVKQPAAAPIAEDDEEAWQSGGRYPDAPPPRRYNSSYGRMPDMPEAELDRRGTGNGIGRRRGPPIPSNELPVWLQGAGGRQADWEDGAQEAAPQWDDWDDDSYADDGNGYARQNEYAQDDYDAEPAPEQRGGWRRIFGRK
jgi:hypothetical protein